MTSFHTGSVLLGATAGICLGFLLALLLMRSPRRQAGDIAHSILAQTEQQRQAETEALLDGVKLAFSDISLDAFKRSSDELLKLAQATLGAERRLQSHQLAHEREAFEARMASVVSQLERMQGLVRELERDRANKFSELAARLDSAGENAHNLSQATQRLADALANSRVRGQWGERMAEDVLKLTGLVENVNYVRQKVLESGARPDITFLLPNDFELHMDVKFPFENYFKGLEQDSEAAAQRYRQAFIRDVRAKIGEVASRGYIAPEQGTVDFALLFIPNEQVYRAIFEIQPALLDEALERNILLVSPVSLIATLALVRRAGLHRRLERMTRDLLMTLADLRRNWGKFVDQEDRLGRRIEGLVEDYRTLKGERQRGLGRIIDRIDGLLEPDIAEPRSGARNGNGADPGGADPRTPDIAGAGSEITGHEVEDGGERSNQDQEADQPITPKAP